MPRPRFDKLSEDKKRAILDAAAAEFSTNGFHAASFNRIIENTGLSKGAMYYYFDDKTDLYATVIDHAVRIYLDYAGDLRPSDLDAETFWPAIEDWSRESFAVSADHPWIVSMARHVMMHASPTGPARRIWDAWTSVARALLDRGQELGLVRTDLPDELLINAVVGLGTAMDRWTLEHWDDTPIEEFQALVPTLTDLFRRLVEPTPKSTT